LRKLKRYLVLGEDRCFVQTPLYCYLHVYPSDVPFLIGEFVTVKFPVKWALESYVGIGFPNGKWYVRVDLLVKRYQPKNVEELIKVLSWVVLEEVCHSLGWLHRKGCEIEERNFLWKLINYSS